MYHPRLNKFPVGRGAASPLALAGLICLVAVPPVALGQEEPLSCALQAIALRNACGNDVADNLWESRAICMNIDDEVERDECLDEVQEENGEERQLCRDQLDARRDVCDETGEDRYVIDLDPANFVADPLMIGSGVTPNTYFPLVPGNRWDYASDEDNEISTVTVLSETKVIEGITTIVVKDQVFDAESMDLIEDTDDYYAQDLEGNVWYFGEIALNYEDGELVDIDGSWKTGRDGAQPGILMFADPQVGPAYRQEFAAAEAEDIGRITSITGTAEATAASCSGDCVITDDFTPIEPDAIEQKVYAPGVGLILELDPESGETVLDLVSFQTPSS